MIYQISVLAVFYSHSCFECMAIVMGFKSVVGVIKFSFASVPLEFFVFKEARSGFFFVLF